MLLGSSILGGVVSVVGVSVVVVCLGSGVCGLGWVFGVACLGVVSGFGGGVSAGSSVVLPVVGGSVSGVVRVGSGGSVCVVVLSA